MYSADSPFWPFIAFRVNGRYWAFLSHNHVPSPPPWISASRKFLKCKCHLNIRRKHRPWAYILGFIELPYFGSEQFSADIFGWTYLYLYLNRCICICIWIKLEQNICICIWKIQIFVFVFAFVFDKTYLTPALITTCSQSVTQEMHLLPPVTTCIHSVSLKNLTVTHRYHM